MSVKDFWKDQTFIALDIETTGFNYTECEIIQLGAVRYENGRATDSFYCILKPQKEVPVFIKQLTGITDKELSTGLSAKEGLQNLLRFVGSHPIVCHNAPFDTGFVKYHLSLNSLPYLSNLLLDTLELSKIYLPFLNNHRLLTVIEGFEAVDEVNNIVSSLIKGEDVSLKPHNALFDAVAAGTIFVKLTELVLTYIPFKLTSIISNISRFSGTSEYVSAHISKMASFQSKSALLETPPDLTKTPLGISLGFAKSHNVLSVKVNDLPNNNLYELEDTNANERPFSDNEHQDNDSSDSQPTSSEPLDSFINSAFATDGYIHRKFSGYVYRKGQVEMAHKVHNTFFNGEYLTVEAGTGIGKTFAYLAPALKFSEDKEKKVYVSTNTKNLQEQIFFKDLPALKKSLPIKFDAVILKGRDNYLCKRKWNELVTNYNKFLNGWELSALTYLIVWQHYTKTGDISENSSFPVESDKMNTFSSIWKKATNDRYFCSGKHCPNNDNCYYQRIRRKSEISNLIIINHHLLLADMVSNRFDSGDVHLIIDEAHNLPDLASSFLGVSLAYYDFNSFFNHLVSTRSEVKVGILPSLKADIVRSVIAQNVKTVIEAEIDELIFSVEENIFVFTSFFNNIADIVKKDGQYGKLRIKEKQHKDLADSIGELITICLNYHKKLFNLSQGLLQISSNDLANYDEHQEKLNGAIDSARELVEELKILKEPEWDNYVFWLSIINTKDTTYPEGVMNCSPLDVSELLQRIVYQHVKSLILTSATLSLRGNFKYFCSKMGLNLPQQAEKENDFKNTETLLVPSPFDFHNQTRVMVPKFLPPHTDSNFPKMSIELLKRVLTKTKGGTLILFTSYKDLNFVNNELKDFLYEKNITLLFQEKSKSRNALLQEFKSKGDAVLLGTSSFWEGIDVPGASLSCLILYKLPFQVPSEPIIEAYYDKLRRNGKDPFMHATLPHSMMKFRQGFGRLIRNNTDKGIVLILDSRIVTKKYGIYYREILPTIIRPVNSPIEIENTFDHWFKKPSF